MGFREFANVSQRVIFTDSMPNRRVLLFIFKIVTASKYLYISYIRYPAGRAQSVLTTEVLLDYRGIDFPLLRGETDFSSHSVEADYGFQFPLKWVCDSLSQGTLVGA
jgi:hypothetical protein